MGRRYAAGVVTKVYSDGDLRIEIEKKTWTLNPQCVTSLNLPLNTSTSRQRLATMNPERCNSMADLSHHRNEPVLTPLPVMASSTGFDKLVREAAQGNMDYVQKYIEQHPNQVDARSGGKSCLQVAAHQGHLNLVKYLLDKGADVNQTDNDKDSTLHYAAFDALTVGCTMRVCCDHQKLAITIEIFMM
ncbi:E3 ubiquitin-protein ligase MIB2-like isoform X2 [Ctenocephalides felis]|uniref:E3 ubiquitin-protein ligase MIB2-like isoform X2 n=1 Tax=Ctenocephalides felis TaxID=7515 RepID=UPI000E6E509A|nr:E3 ubiquitin-protein ligase MIB2-like isoform X2 [Ctenocephalides felis]